MGQIRGKKAKVSACNIRSLSSFGIPYAGMHILVSTDNSATEDGQGNFDAYVVGNGRDAATALELKFINDLKTNTMTYKVGVNLTAENGRITSTGELAGGSSFKHITLNVDEGDTITFTPCGSGLYYPSYGFAFYDANDTFLFANVDSTQVGIEQTIKIPTGAKYFRAGFSNSDANNATYNTFKLSKGTNLFDTKTDEIYDNLLAMSCDYGFVYSAAQSVTSFSKLQDGRVTKIDYTSHVNNNAVTFSRIRMSEVPTGTKYVCFGFNADVDITGSIFVSKKYNDWTSANLITSFASVVVSKDNGLVVPCEIDTLKAAGLEDVFVIFRKDSAEENTSLYCGVFYKTLAHLIREEKSSGGDTPTPTTDDGVKTYIAGQDLATAEGRINASGAIVGNSTFAHITLEVTGGNVVKFTPSSTGIGSGYGWAFYDENDTPIFVNTDGTTVNIEQSVIVPSGAKYFRFGGSLSNLTSSPYNVFTLISKTQVVQQSERQIYDYLLAIASPYSSVYSSATEATSVTKLEGNRITRLNYTTHVTNNAVAFSKLVLSEAPSGTKNIMLSFLPTSNMTINVFVSKKYNNWTGTNIVASLSGIGLSNGKNSIISFDYETIKAAGEDGLFLIVTKTSQETNCNLDCAVWFETIADVLKEKDHTEDYSQKTWNVIGDSITAQGRYITSVKRLLPIQSVNGGLAASTIAINDTYMTGQSIVERVTSGQYAAADVWTVMGGLNDALYNSPLGALATIGSTYDKTTIYGALQAIVEYIMQTERPRLVLLTPAHSIRDLYDTSQHPTTMAAIRQAIIDVGALYGVAVCDLWAESGINLYNAQRATNPTTVDGVHWTDLGAEMAAPVIARKLKEILV